MLHGEINVDRMLVAGLHPVAGRIRRQAVLPGMHLTAVRGLWPVVHVRLWPALIHPTGHPPQFNLITMESVLFVTFAILILATTPSVSYLPLYFLPW